jgi:hypothetical protein
VRSFLPAETLAILRAIDAELSRSCRVVLIGGSAAVLAFGSQRATQDIDFISADEEFAAAVERASQKLGHPIPVSQVGVFTAPYDFEDRLESVQDLGLNHLRLFVPERHDFTIMKIARGYEHDLETIEDLHRAQPLSLDLLVERFGEAKTQTIGSPETFKLNLLALIERLFGQSAAESVDQQLPP